MRHAESLIKVASQIRIFRQQRGRRDSGKILAVPNEVSLIVVSAVDRSLNPILLGLAQPAENFAKPLDAGKALGREAHRGQKSAFQLTGAQAQFPCESREIGSALGQ